MFTKNFSVGHINYTALIYLIKHLSFNIKSFNKQLNLLHKQT